jgi:hypothetical protein
MPVRRTVFASPIRLLPAFLLAVGVACAPSAQASTALRSELAEIAGSLKQLLDGRGESAISVGEFTGPPNYPTSSGPGIVKTLIEELAKRHIVVRPRSNLKVKGQFEVTETRPDPVGKHRFLAVRITGLVEDLTGNTITDFRFERTVPGESALLELMGIPAELRADDTPQGRDRALRERLVDPHTSIAGSRISAAPDSPFGLEVLVDGKPREARNDDGLAMVKIGRGERYAVRLINDSPHEAAVRLSIDGLSMFAFSDLRHASGPNNGEPLYTTLILPPRSRFDVVGWHRTNDESDAFLVTEYAKSAAATLDHRANLGTITASFAAAWAVDGDPPADEAAQPKGLPDSTGFGPRVAAKFTEGRRRIGAIRSSVSVRYAR